MQGVLFKEDSSASKVILVVLILLSAHSYISLFFYKQKKIVYIKWANILFCFFLFYGVLYLFSGKTYVIARGGTEVQSFGFIKQMLVCYLPLFTTYHLTLKGKVSEDDIRCWSILFLITSIVFFYVERTTALRMAMEFNSSRTEFTNNSAYLFAAIIPILIVWQKRPLIQYGLFFICVAFLILSMKRGAILCGGLASVLFLRKTLLQNRKKKGLILVLFLVVFYALYVLISDLMVESDLFLDRIESTLSGNSSGRDSIYSTLLNHLLHQDSIWAFIFGEGANSTLKYAENFAHNDWLEIAICEGAIGVVVYLLYWFAFLKSCKCIKSDKTAHFICSTYLVFFFVRSFFSMSFNDVPYMAAIALGFYFAYTRLPKASTENSGYLTTS